MNVLIGIELGIRVVEELVVLQDELEEPLGHLGCDVRWSPPERMRLALTWHTDTSEAVTLQLREELRALALTQPEFSFDVRGASFDPSEETPMRVFARVSEGVDELEGLRERIASLQGSLGIGPSADFFPAINVGRLRTAADPVNLRGVLGARSDKDFGRTIARELALWEMVSKPGRLESRVIDRIAFGRGD